MAVLPCINSTRTLFSVSVGGFFFVISIKSHRAIVVVLPRLQAMAANTNPSPSQPPRIPFTVPLEKEELEQLMFDIMDPLDIKLYEESNSRKKGKKRRAFRQKLRTCIAAYPQIESTTIMLTAFWGRFHIALGADKSLTQDAALLALYMETEPGATWAPDVNPIVECTFYSIAMLSRLPSLQGWAKKNGQTLKVPEQLRQMIELATDFLKTLHPVMEYAVSGTGRAVAPPSRLLRAILAKQPFMALTPASKIRLNKLMSTLVVPIQNQLDMMTCEDRLSDMLKEDIKTMAFLLSIPGFSDNAARKECEVVIQTWNSQRNLESARRPCCCSLCRASGPGMDTLQNTGGMEETGGGPTPCRNTPPLPLPSNALTQRESTVATPRALTSAASALAFGSGTSSQSMLYPANTMPPPSFPNATYPPSQDNATSQMKSTAAMPWGFTSSAPASALGSGTPSQSMLYSANTTPPQRVPGAAYLPSQSNAMPLMATAMPQMATTVPAHTPPVTNTYSAMGTSATGTSSRPWPSAQSMPTPSHTTTEPALDTLEDLDQDMLDDLASCADMTLEEMGEVLDGYHLEPLAPPGP